MSMFVLRVELELSMSMFVLRAVRVMNVNVCSTCG